MTPDSPPSAEPPPVAPGYYRVAWVVDLPKDEFSSPREAAEEARLLAAGEGTGPDALVNVYSVLDADTGVTTEHDLA